MSVKVILPDFLNVEECGYLLSTFRKHKEIFNDGIDIIGFVGSFEFSKWNNSEKKYAKYQKIFSNDLLYKMSDYYNSLDTSIYIIFDKKIIKEKDLEDEWCNNLMKAFNDSKNYVIVYSNILKDFIKNKYKKINVVEVDNLNTLDYTLISKKDINELESSKIDKSKVIMIERNDIDIPDRKFMFKHNKNDSPIDIVDIKSNLYYNSEDIYKSKSLKTFSDNYGSDNYNRLLEYKDIGINTFLFPRLGVYNVANYIDIISYIYKEEYRYDAIFLIINGLLEYKKHEINEVMAYRI